MAYTPTVWDDDAPLAPWTTDLNHLEAGVEDASVTVFTADNTGATAVNLTLEAQADNAVAVGVPLIIPPGDYQMDGTAYTLPDNISMIAPAGARFFRSSNGVTLTLPTGAYLEGLTVDMTNNTSGASAIQLAADAQKVTLRRCTFNGGTGAQLVYVAEPGIEDLTIDSCTFATGIYGFLSNSTDQTSGSWDLQRVKIINCTFDGFTGDPIEFNHPSSSAPACFDFLVDGCTMINPSGSGTTAGFAIGVAGCSDVTITNNHIAARREAVHVEDDSRRILIAHNTVRSVAGSDANGGIWIYPGCLDVKIDDNTLEGVTGDAIQLVYDGSGTHASDVLITNNVIKSPTIGGISVGANDSASGGPFVITGNYIRSAGGDGISVFGDLDEVVVDNNFISGCTGWGIATEPSGGSTSRLRSYRGNKIVNCTAGDYEGQPMSDGLATVIPQRHARVTSATSGSGTVEVTLFRLGRFAEGYVQVQAWRTNATTNRGEAQFFVRWDGTTFVGYRMPGTHSTNGSFAVNSLSMVSGVLKVNITVTTGNTVDCAAEFIGTCFEDAASYGTTVADSGLAVSGSRGGNAALASLLTKLALAGIITDSSSA